MKVRCVIIEADNVQASEIADVVARIFAPAPAPAQSPAIAAPHVSGDAPPALASAPAVPAAPALPGVEEISQRPRRTYRPRQPLEPRQPKKIVNAETGRAIGWTPERLAKFQRTMEEKKRLKQQHPSNGD